MTCINNPITNIHLSTEEVLQMIDNARISTDAVRDYDSSAGSTISSVWESSELDLSDGDISDGEKSTDYSGTCSPIEPYKCIDDVEVTIFD